MKTIIAVIFFGILTYVFADKLKYGENICQNIEGSKDLNPAEFFKGDWYLTHSTRSKRVTESSICRDYRPIHMENGTIYVTYGYNENGGSENHYDVKCFGNKNKDGKEIFNFDCHLHNARGEDSDFKIDVSFLETDYNNYGILYRCVRVGSYTEDNVMIIYRKEDPKEGEVTEILKRYGLSLDNFISRKNATCTSIGFRKETIYT